MTPEQRKAELDRHVRELAELYDAVQVVATWLGESGRTHSHKVGSGNWYARQHLCQEFNEEDQQDSTAEAIARKLDPPDPLLNP